MSTTPSNRPPPVVTSNRVATLIEQLHDLEQHDTDHHANEYFHSQRDDPGAS